MIALALIALVVAAIAAYTWVYNGRKAAARREWQSRHPRDENGIMQCHCDPPCPTLSEVGSDYLYE
jgi:hypothetical protein